MNTQPLVIAELRRLNLAVIYVCEWHRVALSS